MKNFTAKLRDIQKLKFPIVKAAFKGQDDKIYVGAMMIDTGSVNCILNKSVLPLLGDDARINERSMTIHSVQHKGVECQAYSFSFRMGNGMFSDTFFVNSEMNFDQMFDFPFIGIVGYRFLINHGLVLDYETETLHSSLGTIEGVNEDYAFFFPMSFGLKNYNIPVVGLVCDNKEYVLVADSGANTTILTKHMVEEAGIVESWSSEKGNVTCFTNETIDAAYCDVTLSLISIGGTAENPKIFHTADCVQVTDEYPYLMDGFRDSEGNDILPISGLLSSAFMLKNKWVLDFCTGIMFQRNNGA